MRKSAKTKPCILSKGALVIFAAILISFAPSVFPENIEAPSFAQRDIRGDLQSLSKYEGEAVVLYFWATWCPWCRKDVKNVQTMYARFHPQGVAFISISLDQSLPALEQFAEANQIHYPIIFDGQGWRNEIAQLYHVTATPAVVLLDREHRICYMGGEMSKLPEMLQKFNLLKK